MQPIVTVICTCYNHELYVCEALLSVLNQTYSNIQLIVVDNASTDNSAEVITSFLNSYPSIQFIRNTENLGICSAFNAASQLATGKYLIDLAGDDILMLDRITLQVAAFEKLDSGYGLIFSNVEEVDNAGNHIKYSINKSIMPPSGNVFAALLESYFLPSPSTIFRKDVFNSVGGYNEILAFEDFDFWVKCAHQYKFYYLPIISTKKRILPSSLSSQFYSTKSDRMLGSTLQTYLWAKQRLTTDNEVKAFSKGISYFFRQAVLRGHLEMATKYLGAMKGNYDKQLYTTIARIVLKLRINLSFFINR